MLRRAPLGSLADLHSTTATATAASAHGRERFHRARCSPPGARSDRGSASASSISILSSVGQRFVKNTSEGPNVGPFVEGLPAGLLGTHVGGRSQDHTSRRRIPGDSWGL